MSYLSYQLKVQVEEKWKVDGGDSYRRCNSRFVSVVVSVSLNHFDGDDDDHDDDCDDYAKCVFIIFHCYDYI